MRISFLFGAKMMGPRPIDFANVWDSPRGLTGSEISWLMFAKEMKKRGHEVSLFGPDQAGTTKEWEGIPFNQPVELPDVTYAWIDPDLLRGCPPESLRVVNQQLNDWQYCQPGFGDWVDVITSPSQSHCDHMVPQTPVSPAKWEVLQNGCDPGQYEDGPRVPGRVIYGSCASRGLHLLLERWPEIKALAPEANLRIFYDIDNWINSVIQCQPDPEQVRRAHYIRARMPELEHLGVVKVGSTSRRQMAREFSQAMVLAYPCDPVRFTEGFSVTTMEACASGAVPVISSADSLGQIYGGSVAMVPAPPADHMDKFVLLVVNGLRNPEFRSAVVKSARACAALHTWPVLAERLEEILERRLFLKRNPGRFGPI